MSPTRNWSQSTWLALALGASVAMSGPELGEITKITATSLSDIGLFRGKSYREVQVKMEGTAPGGAYSVPVVLIFPIAATDYNGFAVVDVVNTFTVGDPKWVLGGRVFPVARAHLGDDYLFGNGNFYVGVLWDKTAAEFLQTGAIVAPSDGYEILRDVARLARHPAGAHFPVDFALPRAADKVVAYGYSQSASLLRGWYFRHLNTQGGSPVFDGALIHGAQGSCMELKDRGDASLAECGGALSDGGKVIAIMTEGDAQWTGFVERGETSHYRAIEIAGVSHIPVAAADFRAFGLPGQNPVDAFAAFRAALTNLQDWLRGTEPPPSIYITLKEGPAGSLLDAPYKEAVRDADGNALGGLRLPHMPSEPVGGKMAGAPLGRYGGLDLSFKDTNMYFLLSGTFSAFSPERVHELYPSHDTYVSAVALAAKGLAAKRYILQEDADAYVEAAARSTVGR
jgi:hypothetical protein